MKEFFSIVAIVTAIELFWFQKFTQQDTPEEKNRINALVDELTKDAKSDEEGIKTIVNWIHNNFRSTFGNPKYKTLSQFFEKKRGNCYHHSALLVFMLTHKKIPARFVDEINYDANKFIGVFKEILGLIGDAPIGMNHNNHVWVEAYFDNKWQPVDATYGVVGIEEWLEARLLTNRGRFPLMIYAKEQNSLVQRSEYYLIEKFREVYNINEDQPEFIIWKDDILFLSQYKFEKGKRLSNASKKRIDKAKRNLDRLCKVNNLIAKKKWDYN